MVAPVASLGTYVVTDAGGPGRPWAMERVEIIRALPNHEERLPRGGDPRLKKINESLAAKLRHLGLLQ